MKLKIMICALLLCFTCCPVQPVLAEETVQNIQESEGKENEPSEEIADGQSSDSSSPDGQDSSFVIDNKPVLLGANNESQDETKDETKDESQDEENPGEEEPNGEDEIKTGSLLLNQFIDEIKKDDTDQVYMISYLNDNNQYESKKLVFRFAKGFHATDIGYDGEYRCIGWAGEESTDAASLPMIKELIIEDASGVSDFSFISIDGSYLLDSLPDKFTLEAVFTGVLKDGMENTVTSELTTPYTYFNYAKAQVTQTATDLFFGETASVTVNNISGAGSATCNAYQLNWILPNNVIIEKITLPTFEGADVELSLDNSILIPDGNTISPEARGGEVNLKVIPTKKEFKQVGDMIMLLKNGTQKEKEISKKGDATVSISGLPSETFSTDPITLHLFAKEEESEEPVLPSDDNPTEPVVPTEPTQPEGDTEQEGPVDLIDLDKERNITPEQTTPTNPVRPVSTPTDSLVITHEDEEKPKEKEEEKKPSSNIVERVKTAVTGTTKRNLLKNTDSLVESVGTGLISSTVEDVDVSQPTETGDVIAPSVEEDKPDEIKKEVKKTVKENRSVQMLIAFACVLGLAIVGLALLIRKLSKDEIAELESAQKAEEQAQIDEKEIEIAEEQKKNKEERDIQSLEKDDS